MKTSYPKDFEPPKDFRKRLNIMIERVTEQKGNIAIVTHSGVIEYLTSTEFGKDGQAINGLKAKNCGIYEFQFDKTVTEI